MIRELSPELAKIAKKELNENPKQIDADLLQIKEWIAKQSHLKARTDDQWLVALLRGCKFSMERLKKKLELYYTLRSTAPDVTLRLKPTEPAFLQFLRKGTCLVLPKAKSGLHPRVILIRAGAYDPLENNVADIMCILYYLVQDSMPLRLKGSHHMNMPMGIEVIFTLISGFLNEKAKERLKIHKTADELLDFLPKEIIPVEYGGSGGTLSEITEYWVNKIIEYKSWMQTEEQLGTDESRRVKWDPTDDAVDGSFRKLQID